MDGQRLKIWLLTDGKAGHFNQSRGIAMAFGKRFQVETTTVVCTLRAGVLQRPLRFLLNVTGGHLPGMYFRLFHEADKLPTDKPDLIISAGGSTCCANAWLGRMLNRPNLFCGSPRSLNETLFSGLVTAFPEKARGSNYIVSPTPVPVDPSVIAADAVAFRKRLNLPDARLWSLLVGGDGAGYRYGEMDWRRLADAMEQLAATHGIFWIVTTSRRSGEHAEDILSSRMKPGMAVAASFIHRGNASQLKYVEALGAAERLFCTEDSHMMISEAIATGRPVHTLRPTTYKSDPINLHFLQIYEKDGLLSRHDITTLGRESFDMDTKDHAATPPLLETLAGKLAHWWREVGSEYRCDPTSQSRRTSP